MCMKRFETNKLFRSLNLSLLLCRDPRPLEYFASLKGSYARKGTNAQTFRTTDHANEEQNFNSAAIQMFFQKYC